ncbi:hypothetical protein J2857_003443 [Neorhizobium galegae]|nr:hypothetical protein [Neorhizobium galegae]
MRARRLTTAVFLPTCAKLADAASRGLPARKCAVLAGAGQRRCLRSVSGGARTSRYPGRVRQRADSGALPVSAVAQGDSCTERFGRKPGRPHRTSCPVRFWLGKRAGGVFRDTGCSGFPPAPTVSCSFPRVVSSRSTTFDGHHRKPGSENPWTRMPVREPRFPSDDGGIMGRLRKAGMAGEMNAAKDLVGLGGFFTRWEIVPGFLAGEMRRKGHSHRRRGAAGFL